MPSDAVIFGEIALSGEIRPVSNTTLRLKEASKLGFGRALIPASKEATLAGVNTVNFAKLANLVDHMLGRD
jgi:DNA repair protein RadA/Sms